MKLRTDQVGVFVVVMPVGIDGPEHGADDGWISGGLVEFVSGAGRGLSSDDVVHCLAYDVGRCVAGEEADGDFISGHRWKEGARIAAHVKAMQQKLGHGGVIVDRAGLVDLAIETLERRRVVVLHVDEGKDVAEAIGERKIGAELASVAGEAGRESGSPQARG